MQTTWPSWAGCNLKGWGNSNHISSNRRQDVENNNERASESRALSWQRRYCNWIPQAPLLPLYITLSGQLNLFSPRRSNRVMLYPLTYIWSKLHNYRIAGRNSQYKSIQRYPLLRVLHNLKQLFALLDIWTKTLVLLKWITQDPCKIPPLNSYFSVSVNMQLFFILLLSVLRLFPLARSPIQRTATRRNTFASNPYWITCILVHFVPLSYQIMVN